MPMYSWSCPVCGAALDVLRTFDGYRDEPTDEEAGACVVKSRSPDGSELVATGAHSWEKRIRAPHVTKGASWGGGKGSW